MSLQQFNSQPTSNLIPIHVRAQPDEHQQRLRLLLHQYQLSASKNQQQNSTRKQKKQIKTLQRRKLIQQALNTRKPLTHDFDSSFIIQRKARLNNFIVNATPKILSQQLPVKSSSNSKQGQKNQKANLIFKAIIKSSQDKLQRNYPLNNFNFSNGFSRQTSHIPLIRLQPGSIFTQLNDYKTQTITANTHRPATAQSSQYRSYYKKEQTQNPQTAATLHRAFGSFQTQRKRRCRDSKILVHEFRLADFLID